MKTTRKTLQLLLFLLFLCSGVHAQSGQWTDEGNYDISWYNPSQTEFRLQTPAQLAGLAYLSQKENVNFAGVHIQLDRDINLSAHYWTPVPQFSGWFDGGGHTLDGLLIRDVTAGGEMGFIAVLKSRPIRMTASGVGRLTFGPACRLSGNISGREDAAVGVVAARVEGECLVSDCHFQGTVELTVKDARAYVGGICGDMSGTALGCSHSGRLMLTVEDEGDVDAGGITGRCLSGGVRLTACMNRGRVEANSSSASQRGISLGGIAGTAFSKSILNSCRNAGEVCINSTAPSTSSVLSRAAGLVCCNYGLVINSSNTERVTVNGVRVRAGGICASNHGRIVNSYNTAEVVCNGKKDSGFHNKGGGIAGEYSFSQIGREPLIYRCYNAARITSTGSTEQLGAIAGDLSYETSPSNPPALLRSCFITTPVAPAVGNDYYHQSRYVTVIEPSQLTEAAFRAQLNGDAGGYNDTATVDRMHVWVANGPVLPHFEVADAVCESASYYSAAFRLLYMEERPQHVVLRYRKVGDPVFQEMDWGALDELTLPVSPDTEYEYALVVKSGGGENLMPTRRFRTQDVFEELSVNTTMTTAHALTLIKGDRSLIRKVFFEVGKNADMNPVIATVEGGPMDEYGFVRATISGLNPGEGYCLRVRLETTQGTYYSYIRDFGTARSGAYVKTLTEKMTQSTMTFVHMVNTDKADASLTLKESGSCCIPRDTLQKYPEYMYEKDRWTRVKGEPDTYGEEKNVFRSHFTRLNENCTYFVFHYVVWTDSQGKELTEYYSALNDVYTTLPIAATFEVGELTQTTAQLIGSFETGDAIVLEKGINITGVDYVLEGDETEVRLTEQLPGSSFYAYAYVRTPGGLFRGETKYVKLPDISVHAQVEETGQTFALVALEAEAGDAPVVRTGVEWMTDGQKHRAEGAVARMTGLPANSTVTFRPYAVVSVMGTDGKIYELNYYSDYSTLQTKEIRVTIDRADACSNRSATLHALTECDTCSDAEFGFEWRKYDAPELVPSETVIAPEPVDGRLAFSLRGLTPSTYYKYRAFIRYQGREYFSDWIGFGTADAFVLFPPTVHTIVITAPDGTTVTFVGYIISGSEDILQKGFEYWVDDPVSRTAGKQVVIVEGNDMKATVSELLPHTTYRYRTFATTASGTTYGEERTFTTGEITGVETIVGATDVTLKTDRRTAGGDTPLLVGGVTDGQLLCRVYSATGRLMEQQTVMADRNTTRLMLATSRYAPGVYLVQVICRDRAKTLKFVVR